MNATCARGAPALASRYHTAYLAPKRALVVWGIVVALLLIGGLGSTEGSHPTALDAYLGRAAARSGAGDAGNARVVRGPTREVLVDSHRHPAAAVSLQRRMIRLDVRGVVLL